MTELQAQVEQLVTEHQVPGLVAAVWQHGTLTTGAAGIANLNTGAAMTVDTGYLTGSITKVWMTTLVMTFIDEGLIELDTPVVEYAPEVQFGADEQVAKALTIRSLLNHTNGVDTSDLFADTRGYPDGVEDYLGPITRAGKLTEPGVVSSYNNVGWIVMEIVLRRLTGRAFHDLLRERVIEPLGLQRTVTSPAEAILYNTAVGSFGGEPTPQFMYPDAWAAPGTTLITTVEDTIQFLRMHLAGGKPVISAESAEAMRTPTSPDPTGPDSGLGLGWMYNQRDDRRVLSHGGGSPGGCAVALISPAYDLELAAFVNSFTGTSPLAALVDLVLPDGPSPLEPPATELRDDVDLDPFVGSYQRATQRIDVVRDTDGLLVKFVPLVEDLVGAELPVLSDPTEFRVGTTDETTLVSTGSNPYGAATALSFSEPGPDGYQLLYLGHRLSRRIGTVA